MRPWLVAVGLPAALSLACMGAAPADASPRRVAHLRGDLEGPSLVGSEIAWMDRECRSCFFFGRPAPYRMLIRSLDADAPPQVLASGFDESVAGGSGGLIDAIDFAVSATSFAVRRQQFGPVAAEEPRRLRFGARGLQPPLILSCGAFDRVEYALDGDLLAYIDPCGEGSRLFVVDRATSQRRTIAVAGPGTASIASPRLAGGFVAYRTGEPDAPAAEVRRVSDGSLVYRTSLPPTASYEAFELDDQGRLAVVATAPSPRTFSCAGTGLAWFSPAEPYAHSLPAEPCPSAIRWAGERIVYEDDPDPRGLGTQIRAVGLDSQDALVVDAGDVFLYPFDADGRNVAYGLLACGGGTELFVLSLTERVNPPQARCPVALASRTIPVRRRRARIELRCPRGCAGRLRIRRAGRNLADYRAFGQRGRRETQEVRLTRRGRRMLAARGRIAATLQVRYRDRSLGGKPSRLVRRVTLVRASGTRRRISHRR